jgi:hypothetical protein
LRGARRKLRWHRDGGGAHGGSSSIGPPLVTPSLIGNISEDGTVASPGPTLTYSSTAGNALVLSGIVYAGTTNVGGITGVTDSAGNAWEYITFNSPILPPSQEGTDGTNFYVCFHAWCVNAKAVTSVTVTDSTGHSDFWHVVLSEWSNVGGIDTGSTIAGTGANPTGTISLRNSKCVVIGVADTSAGNITNLPANATRFSSDANNQICYAIPAVAGVSTFAWTMASSDYAVAMLSLTPQKAINYRPNDGSGYWPDFSNTGYKNATFTPSSTAIPCTHGYTGLYDYAAGMSATTTLFVDGSAGQNFNVYHFMGKIEVGHTSGDNFVFNGCVFDGTWPNDNLLQYYLNTTLTFNYCTFKPVNALNTTPPGNNGHVSSCSDSTTDTNSNGTPYLNSWQYISASSNTPQLGTALVRMDFCDVWGNAGLEITTAGSTSGIAYVNYCYLHDQSDPWGVTYLIAFPAGSGFYHQDGVGPDSTGSLNFYGIYNCTIASMGSANGIALQGTTAYNHIGCYGNYISGWSEAVAIGATVTDDNTNCFFQSNIFSGEIVNVCDPKYAGHTGGAPYVGNGACSGYNNISGFLGTAGSRWRANYYQVRAGDPELTTGMNGEFWWPSDNNGHVTDYAS